MKSNVARGGFLTVFVGEVTNNPQNIPLCLFVGGSFEVPVSCLQGLYSNLGTQNARLDF